MVYAIFDSAKNKAVIARAGHEKPLFYSAKTGAADFVNSRGIAIGMVGADKFDAAISDVELDFCEGDAMMFYTDGVNEAVNPEGEEFSARRLKGIFEKSAAKSAEQLNETITRAIAGFACKSRPTDDDFTLLSVRRGK